MISAEAPVIFAKACEIFILELTLRSWIHTEEGKRRTLQKSDVSSAISKNDMFDFLIDIVPREEYKGRKPEVTRIYYCRLNIKELAIQLSFIPIQSSILILKIPVLCFINNNLLINPISKTAHPISHMTSRGNEQNLWINKSLWQFMIIIPGPTRIPRQYFSLERIAIH